MVKGRRPADGHDGDDRGHLPAQRFLERLSEFWAELDPGQLHTHDLWHPGAQVTWPGMTRAVAVEDFPRHIAAVKTLLPEIRIAPLDWATRGDVLFVEWSATGRTSGGTTLAWNGTDKLILRGERAESLVGYFDMAPLQRALAAEQAERQPLAERTESQATNSGGMNGS